MITIIFKFEPNEKVTDQFGNEYTISDASFGIGSGNRYYCDHKDSKQSRWIEEAHLTLGWK